MKVAFITNYWKNSNGGGVEITLTKLAQHYVEDNGIPVKVIFRLGEDSGNFGVKPNKIVFCIRAYSILKKISPDIIHAQGGWFSIIPAIMYKMKYDKPIVYLFHTSIVQDVPWYKQIIYNFLLNRCDCVCFVSHYHEKNIREKMNLKLRIKTKVIISGVDHDDVAMDEVIKFKNQFRLMGATPLVLGMGLTALKNKAEGAKKLIDAISLLKDRYPNIKLVLTREGQYSEELRQYVNERNLSDCIIFTGTVTSSWVALHSCDIYAHISFGESLGLAALEAMSIGKPVVAAKGGGMDDVIENNVNGILVGPHPEQIAHSISILTEDTTIIQRLTKNARVTIEQNYTWKIVASKYISIYNDLTSHLSGGKN